MHETYFLLALGLVPIAVLFTLGIKRFVFGGLVP